MTDNQLTAAMQDLFQVFTFDPLEKGDDYISLMLLVEQEGFEIQQCINTNNVHVTLYTKDHKNCYCHWLPRADHQNPMRLLVRAMIYATIKSVEG